jgi:hypothetical protein
MPANATPGNRWVGKCHSGKNHRENVVWVNVIELFLHYYTLHGKAKSTVLFNDKNVEFQPTEVQHFFHVPKNKKCTLLDDFSIRKLALLCVFTFQ